MAKSAPPWSLKPQGCRSNRENLMWWVVAAILVSVHNSKLLTLLTDNSAASGVKSQASTGAEEGGRGVLGRRRGSAEG